jgi:hypothetical protein
MFGVVGGGISGLYCALKLSEKHKVVLIDERDYLGGRIKTQHKMELGAARFNSSHTILLSLIKRYDLHPIRLPRRFDYIHCDHSIVHYKNAHKAFDACIQSVLDQTPLDDSLRDISFYTLCQRLLGDEAPLLLSVFGYYTEMKELNAYDAIQTFQKDFIATTYYILEEGLSTLCDCMAKEIRRNGSIIYTNEKVLKTTKNRLHTTRRTIDVDHIIFCTKASQMVGFPKLKNYTRFLYEAPLLRIYAKYKTPWFKDLHRITTNNILRQIIPIGDGIIMVSYTDGKDTEPFIPLLKKEKELIHLIQTNLSLLFPEHTIPYPEYIVPYFWEVGTHAWKPGAHSDRMYDDAIHPYENVYVCGEAYSKHQAWMEGALNMAQDVLSKLNLEI